MSSIVIPRRFCGFAPSGFFDEPEGMVMMSADPWGYGPCYDVVYRPVTSRCRCPVHAPSVGPARRSRHGVRRPVSSLADDILRGYAPTHRRAQCFEMGDGGDPTEYVTRLMQLLLPDGRRDRERDGGVSVKKSEGGEADVPSQREKEREKSCGESRNASCSCKSCPSEEGNDQPSTSTSDSSTKTGNSEKGEVAKTEDMKDPFSVSINIGDYLPENVNVSVDGRRVIVRAKRDKEGDGRRWVGHSEVEYSFLVPENMPTEGLTSSFGTDGLLSITAATPTGNEGSEEMPAAIETQDGTEQTTEVMSEVVADDTDKDAESTETTSERNEDECEADVEQDCHDHHPDAKETDEEDLVEGE